MSRLQNRAKPVLLPFLEGRWPVLSAEDQTTLAAWATMSVMVFEFADMDSLVTPQVQRERFRKDQTPPEGWAIWVGHYNGSRWKACFTHHSYSGFLNPAEPVFPPRRLPDKGNVQTTSFVVGSLFVHAFSSLPPLPAMPAVERSGVASRFGLRCIWPDAPEVAEPPDVVLDDLQADWISRALVSPEQQHLVRHAWEG